MRWSKPWRAASYLTRGRIAEQSCEGELRKCYHNSFRINRACMRSHKLDAVFLSGSSVPQGCAAGKDGMARHSFFQFFTADEFGKSFRAIRTSARFFYGFSVFPRCRCDARLFQIWVPHSHRDGRVVLTILRFVAIFYGHCLHFQACTRAWSRMCTAAGLWIVFSMQWWSRPDRIFSFSAQGPEGSITGILVGSRISLTLFLKRRKEKAVTQTST